MSSSEERGPKDGKFVDRALFRDVIGRFASGVTVITSRHDGTNFGITASAVASLSMDPPMIVVCVNRQTGTDNAISKSGVFAVNILDEDQGEMALTFARPATEKFESVNVTYGELGEPLIADVLAHLECRVAEQVGGGTHSVFLAEVQNADARPGTPLAYYRGRFGRFEGAENDRVYGQLRHQILSRDLNVAEPLNVDDLAHSMEVPSQTIYYALTRLSSEDMLTREAEGEFRVNPLDAAAYRESVDARCMIELGVAERAVGRISSEKKSELVARAQATVPHIQDGRFVDYDAYMETNKAFHEHLVSLANNELLLDSYRELGVAGILLRTLHEYEANDAMTRGHVEIAEAFEREDLDAVRRLIIQHSENSKRIGEQAIEHAGGKI